MGANGYMNGWEIEYSEDKKQWVYANDKEIIDNNNIRPCPKCHCKPTKEGYDACLGKLPGITASCCGHGISKGYMLFENGRQFYFDDVNCNYIPYKR